MRNDSERLSSEENTDVIDLVRGVWGQKVLLFTIAALVTLAAVVFASTSTPIYESRAFVQPPSQTNISSLNYGRGGASGLEMLRIKDVYEVYLRHLQSESLRRTFFQVVYLPTLTEEQRKGSQDALYARFNRSFMIAPASKADNSRFMVTVVTSDPARGAGWAAAYVKQAGDLAKDELLKSVKSDISLKAENLQQKIDADRETVRQEREDKVVRLQEALRIAKSVEIERPLVIGGNATVGVTADVGELTYMRGVKALESEIENLRSRESDDSFIKSLREEQVSLAFYKSFNVKPDSVQVYRPDGEVDVPDEPVKPRKFLIVVMGLFLGLGLGVLATLLRFLWRRSSSLH